MILLRRELGDVLREQRQDQGRTLRDVSSSAKVSLGYLSEIERGGDRGEHLGGCLLLAALGLQLSETLELVSQRVAVAEAIAAPVRLPVGQREHASVVHAA